MIIYVRACVGGWVFKALRDEIEANGQELKTSKAGLQKSSTQLILENTRVLKKQVCFFTSLIGSFLITCDGRPFLSRFFWMGAE
jgi:hypothetical protein